MLIGQKQNPNGSEKKMSQQNQTIIQLEIMDADVDDSDADTDDELLSE